MKQKKASNKFYYGMYKLVFAFGLFLIYTFAINYLDNSSISSADGGDGGVIALMVACFIAILLTVFYLLISVLIPSIIKVSSHIELKIDIALFIGFLTILLFAI